MPIKLTESYTPTITYQSNYNIGSKENERYINSLSKYLYGLILKSARAYSQKHLLEDGAKSRSNSKPKEVTVTDVDIKQSIIKSKGISPDGTPIYFGPITLMRNPTKAIELGLMSPVERMRKPSVDRIDSTKGYTPDNIQITTMEFNLGKGVGAGTTVKPIPSIPSIPSVTIRYKGVEVQFGELPDSTFLANYTSSLANN